MSRIHPAWIAAALVIAFFAPTTRAGERALAMTEHYEVSTAGSADEAAEFGRVLEAAWPQMTAFFGAAPKLAKDERMKVALFEDDASFRTAITDGGGVAPSSGGYYCPVAKTSYLKRQPTHWYTRNLLLHEAGHQFHYRARTGNAKPHGSWYIEGLAEHLGSHTWDGAAVRVGVTPLLSLEDRAGKALTTVAAPNFSLRAALDADSADRPFAMYFVRFLREADGGKRRKKFDALARKLDRGAALDGKKVLKAFGNEKALLAELRAWLPTVQEPLMPVFNEWETRTADIVLGRATVVSTCRTRVPVRRVSASMHLPDSGPVRAGLLLSHVDASDYTVVLLTGSDGKAGALRVDRMAGGKWTNLHGEKLAAPLPQDADGGIAVAAERNGEGEVTLFVNGLEVRAFELPGDTLGFAVDNCAVEFRGIEITPAGE